MRTRLAIQFELKACNLLQNDLHAQPFYTGRKKGEVETLQTTWHFSSEWFFSVPCEMGSWEPLSSNQLVIVVIIAIIICTTLSAFVDFTAQFDDQPGGRATPKEPSTRILESQSPWSRPKHIKVNCLQQIEHFCSSYHSGFRLPPKNDKGKCISLEVVKEEGPEHPRKLKIKIINLQFTEFESFLNKYYKDIPKMAHLKACFNTFRPVSTARVAP